MARLERAKCGRGSRKASIGESKWKVEGGQRWPERSRSRKVGQEGPEPAKAGPGEAPRGPERGARGGTKAAKALEGPEASVPIIYREIYIYICILNTMYG